MKCREARDRLTADTVARSAAVSAHLSQCAVCARFAQRMRAARALLREHHAEVEPGIAFAQRVVARLQVSPEAKLGWAAVRMLPVTFVLLLLLAWWSWQGTPSPSSLFAESPTEDLLTWVLDRAGEDS